MLDPCVRCIKTIRVTVVGTHGSCVRWVKGYGVRWIKGYSVVVLTGTDALPLDTSVRPYKGLHVSSAEEFGNR